MTDDSIDQELLAGLASILAVGKLSYSVVKPVLNQLTAARPAVGITRILAQLDGLGFVDVAAKLSERRDQDADEYYTARTSLGAKTDTDRFRLMLGDLPMNAQLGWSHKLCSTEQFSTLLKVVHDRRFAMTKRSVAPITAQTIHRTCEEEGRRFFWSVHCP